MLLRLAKILILHLTHPAISSLTTTKIRLPESKTTEHGLRYYRSLMLRIRALTFDCRGSRMQITLQCIYTLFQNLIILLLWTSKPCIDLQLCELYPKPNCQECTVTSVHREGGGYLEGLRPFYTFASQSTYGPKPYLIRVIPLPIFYCVHPKERIRPSSSRALSWHNAIHFYFFVSGKAGT